MATVRIRVITTTTTQSTGYIDVDADTPDQGLAIVRNMDASDDGLPDFATTDRVIDTSDPIFTVVGVA